MDTNEITCVAKDCYQQFKFTPDHEERYGKFCRSCHHGTNPHNHTKREYILVMDEKGRIRQKAVYKPIVYPQEQF